MLRAAVAAGRHCYIADIAFCSQERRERTVLDLRTMFPAVRIEFRFYANNPEQCRRNLLDDPAGNANRLAEIDKFSPGYQVPAGEVAVPVAMRPARA